MNSKFLALSLISLLLFSGVVSAKPSWVSEGKEVKGQLKDREIDRTELRQMIWQGLDQNSMIDINSLERRFMAQGRFIAGIQQIKKAQWKELHEYLKDNDYKIPSSYFTVSLNEKARELKDLVRKKLSDQNFDGNFTLKMISELSEREFLSQIESKLNDLNISDQNLLEALETIDYNKYFEGKKPWLEKEFKSFNPKFKKKLFLLWLSSDKTERDALIQQLKDYIQSVQQTKQERKELKHLAKDLNKNKLEKLREMIQERRKAREILGELRGN